MPLEFQAVPDPKIAPLWMNLPRFRQLCQGNFLDVYKRQMYDLISFLRLDFINFYLHIFVILVFEQVNCVRVAVKNLPYRKSAQISVRDALFTAAPYQLHSSA